MEIVSIKLEENFLKDIERIMKKHSYATKAEFIREAIKEKVKELKKEELMIKARKLYGASKRKTSDAELHLVGEKAFEELEEEIR